MWTKAGLWDGRLTPIISPKDCNRLTPHVDSRRQTLNALWEFDSSKLCYKSCLSWFCLSCLACLDSTSSSDGDFHYACLTRATSGARLDLLQERAEMKFLLTIAFFVFAHLSCAQSQNQTGADILNLAIKELPSCAVSTKTTVAASNLTTDVQLKCTLSTVGASSCELTDIACIKGNKVLLNDLSVCVKSSCKIREALSK